LRILCVGAGGVGSAAATIASRRDFFECFVVADYDLDRSKRAVATLSDERFTAARVDASSAQDVLHLCREHRITHVLNAVDPRFVMPIFHGAFAAGADVPRTNWSAVGSGLIDAIVGLWRAPVTEHP